MFLSHFTDKLRSYLIILNYCSCWFMLLPRLVSQSFELTLELLVGLLLLIQVSLQLLLAVLQSVDLLLSFIHLSLQRFQTQIQLHEDKKPKSTVKRVPLR